MLHELTENQKHRHSEVSSSLTLCNNSKPFSIWLWPVTKSGFFMTTGDNQLSGWTKKKLQSTFQSQTSSKKKSWSVFAGVWSATTFWVLVKPLHPRMFSKSVRCTKNRNVCSWHWSTERTQFFSMTMLDHALHNQHFKSWTNGIAKFYLICHIHLTSLQLSTTSSSISTIFCRENTSTTSRMQKILSTVHQILKHDFYATGINKLISHWQNYVDHNGSYLDE